MIDPSFWEGRRVFLTGHTGFKGSWAALMLRVLGAEVFGFALEPDDDRSLFVTAGVQQDLHHRVGNIINLDEVHEAMTFAAPSIVLHFAAQSLVRRSYEEPVLTYQTNVIGTANVLEAARHQKGIEAVLVVTSDKCYENVGSLWGYREIDRLGGHDPYSNSKACTELVTDSFRRSYFHRSNATQIASARAGNVIGGGDWARDRLIPDAVQAFIAGRPLFIRNPEAVRPWQHVIDPLLGYFLLAERLTSKPDAYADGWNFGPDATSEVPVRLIADALTSLWGGSASWQSDDVAHPHEAAHLKLDCTKATARLGWGPLIDLDQALRLTIEWYRGFAAGADLRAVAISQIDAAFQTRVAPTGSAWQRTPRRGALVQGAAFSDTTPAKS